MLPFSQACENNKRPILNVLSRHLRDRLTLLEIGGGTGQHAAYFAEHLPHVNWQSSDIPANVESLNLRIRQTGLANLPEAIPLDVDARAWPLSAVDAIFSANCLHIVSEDSVKNFFVGAGEYLCDGGLLLVYGPFKYDGEFTSQSNVDFDHWLKRRDPVSGIREFEWINELAQMQGLRLVEDNAMPANNRMLVWRQAADIVDAAFG